MSGLTVSATAAAPDAHEKDARYFGVSREKTAAENATAMQAAFDGLSPYGGTVIVREPYPCNRLAQRKNVTVRGDQGPRFKGPYPYGGGTAGLAAIPAGPAFLITDTSGPFLSLEGANGVIDLTFHHPNQNYAATTLAGVVAYPPTIANASDRLWNVYLSGLAFIGSHSCIDFNYVPIAEGSDMLIETSYGYPLGGRFLRLRNVFDIPRIQNCHVNPGQGSRFLGHDGDNVFYPNALLDAIIAGGQPAFEVDTCDEMEMFKLFVFAAKTGFRIVNTYGSLDGCKADCVETALYASPNAAHKVINVNVFNCIPNAGPTPANRNAVVFEGAGGFLKLQQLHAFLGTNGVIPSSTNSNCNSLVRVNGSGSQRVDVISGTKASLPGGGAFTHHVQQVNASAIVNQQFSP